MSTLPGRRKFNDVLARSRKVLSDLFPGRKSKRGPESEFVAGAKVVFHPGASEDYAAAFAWYHVRGTTLASDFESEVDRAIRLISQHPSRWPKFDDQRRRLIVRKFPYSIIYELHGDDVLILAVAHGKRRPYYRRERATEE